MSPIEIFVDHSSIRGITENLSSPEWSSIITLFNDVQSHLIQSKSTRSAYLEILVDFYNLNDEARALLPKPMDEDVLHYFQDNFPHVHVRSSLHPNGTLVGPDWQCRSRPESEPRNDIRIVHEVIMSMRILNMGADRAQEFHLGYDAFAMCTVIMFLHALRYSLIEHVFASLPNPPQWYQDGRLSLCLPRLVRLGPRRGAARFPHLW
ncbi:hypothetical protein BKA93DRAFT_59932 [Sparassis latifolia]